MYLAIPILAERRAGSWICTVIQTEIVYNLIFWCIPEKKAFIKRRSGNWEDVFSGFPVFVSITIFLIGKH